MDKNKILFNLASWVYKQMGPFPEHKHSKWEFIPMTLEEQRNLLTLSGRLHGNYCGASTYKNLCNALRSMHANYCKFRRQWEEGDADWVEFHKKRHKATDDNLIKVYKCYSKLKLRRDILLSEVFRLRARVKKLEGNNE